MDNTSKKPEWEITPAGWVCLLALSAMIYYVDTNPAPEREGGYPSWTNDQKHLDAGIARMLRLSVRDIIATSENHVSYKGEVLDTITYLQGRGVSKDTLQSKYDAAFGEGSFKKLTEEGVMPTTHNLDLTDPAVRASLNMADIQKPSEGYVR